MNHLHVHSMLRLFPRLPPLIMICWVAVRWPHNKTTRHFVKWSVSNQVMSGYAKRNNLVCKFRYNIQLIWSVWLQQKLSSVSWFNHERLHCRAIIFVACNSISFHARWYEQSITLSICILSHCYSSWRVILMLLHLAIMSHLKYSLVPNENSQTIN